MKLKLYQSALENLEAARKLIRYHYITGTFSRNCNGKECSPRSPKAVSFCALGAVRNVNGPGARKATSLLRAAANRWLRENRPNFVTSGNNAIFRVNDRFGKQAVLNTFKIAIKLAKSA